ncbi:hypothetical protein P9X10_02520 [Bacillus cereus]|nr:hypothetical protein [Bacillus cereus]
MKKTKLFKTMSKEKENGVSGYEDVDVDTQMNEFFANNDVDVISVSLTSAIDEDGSSYECALLVYDDKVKQLTKEELAEARKDIGLKPVSYAENIMERIVDMERLCRGVDLDIPLLWAKHGNWLVDLAKHEHKMMKRLEEKKEKEMKGE